MKSDESTSGFQTLRSVLRIKSRHRREPTDRRDSIVPESPVAVVGQLPQQFLDATFSSVSRLSIGSEEFTNSPSQMQSVQRFKNAVTNLQNSVPRDFRPLDIHQAIGLQHLSHIDNVKDTVENLYRAIEEYAQLQPELRVTAGRLELVRDFVRNWFMASFPFMVQVLQYTVMLIQLARTTFLALTGW